MRCRAHVQVSVLRQKMLVKRQLEETRRRGAPEDLVNEYRVKGGRNAAKPQTPAKDIRRRPPYLPF